MPHVVLLGDSIFDNGAYTGGGPEVITQLRGRLPSGWAATLLAVDGATVGDIPRQLDRLPADATHLVLSAGGNDALAHTGLLEQPVRSAAAAFGALAEAAAAFERRYRAAVDLLARRALPLVVCTIYNGSFPDPFYQRLAATGLCAFNDVILRAAVERGLTVIELRLVCSEAADYANPIEPSSAGGAKIARAIARAVGTEDGVDGAARVLGR